MVCKETVLEPETKPQAEGQASTQTVQPHETAEVEQPVSPSEDNANLLFRCIKCKRLAHYDHLPRDDEDQTVGESAYKFQKDNEWQCADCVTFTFRVSVILAWRPYPKDAPDAQKDSQEPPNYRDALAREYLVKWDGRSYRRAQWVPHMWLLSTAPSMLRNFIVNGSRV